MLRLGLSERRDLNGISLSFQNISGVSISPQFNAALMELASQKSYSSVGSVTAVIFCAASSKKKSLPKSWITRGTSDGDTARFLRLVELMVLVAIIITPGPRYLNQVVFYSDGCSTVQKKSIHGPG